MRRARILGYASPTIGDSMRILTILGEILPVLGTVGLLGLWFYQQTQIEQRASELRKLESARSVYQTYQSNNAIFNAINEVIKNDKTGSAQLRRFQVYNYELGLQEIEPVMSESERAVIPDASSAYSSAEDIQVIMANTQKRLGDLQIKLNDKEASLSQTTQAAKIRYMWWYIVLSIVTTSGAVFKIIDKLSQQ